MNASKPATSERVGLDRVESSVGEDLGIQVVGQAFTWGASGDECCQDSDAPGPALGGDLTD